MPPNPQLIILCRASILPEHQGSAQRLRRVAGKAGQDVVIEAGNSTPMQLSLKHFKKKKLKYWSSGSSLSFTGVQFRVVGKKVGKE